MNFLFHIHVGWGCICLTFGATVLIGFFMHLLSKNFYTLHVFVRKFSMLDLEFPVSALELATYIKGIFLLPKEISQISLRSLRTRLYLHFLFIPLKYLTVFFLCMRLSEKMSFLGNYIFIILAWMQIIPFICDLVENFYLLQKLHPDSAVSTPSVHKKYQLLGRAKWAVFLIAIAFSVSSLFYFWLTGSFSNPSLKFLIILIVELLIIFVLIKMTKNSSKINLDQYQNVGN
ncbi:MAG TPA: hypothetical protein VIJ75_20880 [Hanamia sp.]